MTHSSFVVITRTHGLLPLARRLRSEGHPVHLMVWDPLYTRQVDGPLAGDPQQPEDLQWAIAEAEGGAVVVTDLEGLRAPFGNAHRFLGPLSWPTEPYSPLRLGGWFDGEDLQCPHVLVADVGPFGGGAGDPRVLGGLTLVNPDPRADLSLLRHLWTPVLAELKARDFVGLVSAGVGTNEVGAPELTGVKAGWPGLHTAVWLSELEGLGDVLTGVKAPALDPWAHRYVTALPVSIPPWPNLGDPAAEPPQGELLVEGLTPQQLARVFWHDVVVDTKRRAVVAAQRDGLVGVARGAAHCLELSRARALEIGLAAQVAGKQLRADLGQSVAAVLSALEQGYGVQL